jgi:hypothetical protein
MKHNKTLNIKRKLKRKRRGKKIFQKILEVFARWKWSSTQTRIVLECRRRNYGFVRRNPAS